MDSRFDRDTAITPTEGGWEARIDRGWWIVMGPNGGYLPAILLRAAQALAGEERAPLLLTTHYVRPPAEGPALVEGNVVREGRTVTSVMVRMHQEGRLIAFATSTLSAPRAESMTFSDLPAPRVPPPEDCPAFPPAEALVRVPISERYEYRHAIGSPPWSGADRAEIGGWVRTEDGRETDALLVAALTDAWIPAVFCKLEAAGTAVPTVELTVHFRERVPRPAGEWVLARFTSRVAAGGYVEEDGELWSDDGVLIAQSRQLAVLSPLAG